MGIDPVTHKPKSDGILIGGSADGQSKSIANLSHMAQWESARLEAESRLVRDSKLRAPSTSTVPPPLSLQLSQQQQQQQQSLDLDLGAWQGVWPKPTSSSGLVISPGQNVQIDLQSPTSTLSFSAAADNTLQPSMGSLVDPNSTILMCRQDQRDELEDQRVEVKCFGKAIGRIMSSMTDNMTKDDDGNHRMGGILLASAAAGFSLMDTTSSTAAAEAALWINPESSSSSSNMIIRSSSSGGDFRPPAAAGLFTELLLDDKCVDKQNSHQRDTDHRADHESDNNAEGGSRVMEDQDDHDHESNNYWNNILDLVNPSNSPPPVF